MSYRDEALQPQVAGGACWEASHHFSELTLPYSTDEGLGHAGNGLDISKVTRSGPACSGGSRERVNVESLSGPHYPEIPARGQAISQPPGNLYAAAANPLKCEGDCAFFGLLPHPYHIHLGAMVA